MKIKFVTRSIRVVGQVYLESPFNCLRHCQKQGQQCKYQRNTGDPEGKPLRPVATVVPPLRNSARGRLVVGLLQHPEPVPPKIEPLDAAFASGQASALAQTFVHEESVLFLVALAELGQPRSFPALGPPWPVVFGLWEEEGDCFDGFLG